MALVPTKRPGVGSEATAPFPKQLASGGQPVAFGDGKVAVRADSPMTYSIADHPPADPLDDGKSYLRLIDSMGNSLSVVNDARQSFDKETEVWGDKEAKLLYRGSEDGFKIPNFDKKCLNISPSFLLIKSKEHQQIFGWYSNISWQRDSGWKTYDG